MANFQKIVSANAYHNVGATMLYAGDISSNSIVSNPLSLTVTGYRSGKNGSVVPVALTAEQIAALSAGGQEGATGRSHVPLFKMVSAGTYAIMAQGTYVVRKLASTLGGVANTVLLFGASNFGRKSIYNTSRIRTTFLSGLAWVSGTNGPTVTYTRSNRDALSNDFGADDASRPTKAIPGELTYMFGAKTASNFDYAARTA